MTTTDDFTRQRQGTGATQASPSDLRPIDGATGYFLLRDPGAPEGWRVLSMVKRKYWGNGWRDIAVIDGKVRIPVRGVYRRLSVRGLARGA